MASRTKHHGRSSRDSDSMEAIKPLVVLALFGTILYGAYSVVQKGPSPTDAAVSPPAVADAPAFAPPAVEIAASPAAPPPVTPEATPPQPAPAVATPVGLPASPPTPPATPPSSVAGVGDAAPPPAVPPLAPPAAFEPPAAPPTAAAIPAAAAPPAVAEPTPGITAAAAGAGAAIGASLADAAATGSTQPPVYLTAESAPPPTHEPPASPVPAAAIDATSRPDRFATLPAPQPPATQSLQPDALPAPPPAAAGSPAAFATAWADAHDKLAAGRYAEALAALSVWYDDPSLGLEESQRLEDLLGQLAGTVIYSQQDLLLPPQVVAPGETLQSIAMPLGISPRLLGKINGIDDPHQLVAGEHLKVIRGPFDAVVSVSRRRLSLQLGGSYAGSFPVVVGRQFLTRVGSSIVVVETSRGPDGDVLAVGGTTPAPPAAKPAIVLDGGLVIEAADDPGVVSDTSPATSLVVSIRDLAELVDILGPGSKVLIRQ